MTERAEPTDRALRILHVLRAPLGGLFRHVLDLAREQIARGHAVGLVVDSTTGGQRADDILAELAPSLKLGLMRMPMRRQPHASDLAALFKIALHARRLGVDVIHGHGSKGGLYARAPGLIGLNRGAIRCYTPHGGSFNQSASPLMQTLYMAVESALARTTNVLLFESVFIANRFRERVGDTTALVRIVQNGISPAEFEPVIANDHAADLLYVGELRAAKGIDTLIDATAILSKKLDRPLKLVLVGSGPDQAKLERYASLRGIAGQVAFAGALPARQAFAMGRILVVPSRAESLPYIVLEAAGAQIPMVATNVGGIGEVFGPYRDRLIVPDDPDLLAKTIQDAIETNGDGLRAQAKALAAFVATRFSISIMADSVITGYRDALAQRALPSKDPTQSYAIPS